MRSIARRVRSRSPFRRRRKATELVEEIRAIEIDYSTRLYGEHEQPAETSAIEIVLESSRIYEAPPEAPVRKVEAPPEPIDSRTMSTSSTEQSPEKEAELPRSKRMSFRDRFMNKRTPGEAPSRRGRSRKRSPDQRPPSRDISLLDQEEPSTMVDIQPNGVFEPRIVTRMKDFNGIEQQQEVEPAPIERGQSGMSGIPLDDMEQDGSLLTAGAGPSKAMEWSDVPFAVQANHHDLKRTPMSELTLPKAFHGKGTASDDSDSEDEEDDHTPSPPAALAPQRSMGEESTDQVQRALEEVENELNEAAKTGKKISRDMVAKALFSVADRMENPVERNSTRRQLEKLMANEKHTQTRTKTIKGKDQSSEHKLHRGDSESAHRDDKEAKIGSRENKDSRTEDDSRSMGSESTFNAWAAQIEDDDLFSFDSRPEGDFFSDVFGFFIPSSEGNKKEVDVEIPKKEIPKKQKKATRRQEFATDRKSAAQVPPSFDESDVFADVAEVTRLEQAHSRLEQAHSTPSPRTQGIDVSNEYELPPPPHALKALPLFGTRSTLETAPIVKPSTMNAERLAPNKPRFRTGRSAKPAGPPTSPFVKPAPPVVARRTKPLLLPQTFEDELSLSSIESDQYQPRHKNQSRPRDDTHLPASSFSIAHVLSDDTVDAGAKFQLGSKQRTVQPTTRQRSKSAHPPRRRNQGNRLVAV